MIIYGDRVAIGVGIEIVPRISDAMAGFQSPEPDKLKTPSGLELRITKEVGQGNAMDVVDSATRTGIAITNPYANLPRRTTEVSSTSNILGSFIARNKRRSNEPSNEQRKTENGEIRKS
jgi:hypothetical protein